jgi:hypothetical protein
VYLACTFPGPFIYPRYTRGRLSAGPGRRTAVVRQPSLLTSGSALEGREGLARRRGSCPCREAASAPGGRQATPLLFSAWDSATAAVNSGASTPPALPAPCQVTSQVIVAVVWNAPPGCPALELV